MASFLRKRYLINPRFQLTFIAFNLFSAFLVSSVFYGSFRYVFSELHRLGVEAGLPEDDGIFTFLSTHSAFVNQVFLLTALGAFVVLAAVGVYLSHKVAGPMYRLNDHLNRIAHGEAPGPVKFREGDFFREIATSYNAHLRTLLEGNSAKKNKDKEKAA